jgi:two-component system chemotaxis response regulator CheY
MSTVTINQISVLLVEPSSVQQKMIVNALHTAGITSIELAKTKQAALSYLKSYGADLVISAMYFEDGTADELLLDIRHNPLTENQAFMLVSSERHKEYLEKLRQAGVLAILPKPFSSEDLTRALKATADFISDEELNLEFFEINALRVLVVDDSRLARKHIRRVLGTMGIEKIDEAEDGQQAIVHLNEAAYDLIVTDYNMPHMDGRELAAAVRSSSQWTHIPVLMVSSESNETHLANIAQAGVDAICDKPFEPATVRALLERILN